MQGTRARPLAHLYEAVKLKQKGKNVRNCSAKTRKILDIWEEGSGVVCLQVFGNSFQAESLSREAAIIEAIG